MKCKKDKENMAPARKDSKKVHSFEKFPSHVNKYLNTGFKINNNLL